MSESSVEAVEYNPDNRTQQLYALSSDCLGELSHVYFQFADFLLYDCTMINHGFEVNYMMNYISPHRKITKPRDNLWNFGTDNSTAIHWSHCEIL